MKGPRRPGGPGRRGAAAPRPAARAEDLAALFNDARAAWKRGDRAATVERCEAILARKKNDFNALMLMADVAGDTGTVDDEIHWITRAVRVQPKNAALRVHLGRRYFKQGQLDPAFTQFDRALRIESGLVTAVSGVGHVYEARNRYDRARQLLEPFVRGAATDPAIASVFLRVLVHDGDLDAAIDLGRAVAGADRPPSLELRSVLSTLAKALERSGQPGPAFETAQRANEMLAQAHDPAAVRARVDDLRRVFTRERLATLPRSTYLSDLPIFIVGMPRSGSTLVERIIHAHPDAWGSGELDTVRIAVNDLSIGIDSDLPFPDRIVNLREPAVTERSRRFIDETARLAPRAKRIVNKHLSNYMRLGVVNLLFPAGRVIHCRRDPVDTCLSCFMERLQPTQAPFTRSLELLGFHYTQYRRLMRHWMEVIDMPRLEVDYEELVADQEGVSRRLIEFCGLPWDDACLRYYEVERMDGTLSLDQVRRPIYRTSVGRAEKFGALLDPLRRALGSETS